MAKNTRANNENFASYFFLAGNRNDKILTEGWNYLPLDGIILV